MLGQDGTVTHPIQGTSHLASDVLYLLQRLPEKCTADHPYNSCALQQTNNWAKSSKIIIFNVNLFLGRTKHPKHLISQMFEVS